MGYYELLKISIAAKLLGLHRLWTGLVITGDCLDRLESMSSGLRASSEPRSRGPTAGRGLVRTTNLLIRHVHRAAVLPG